MKNKNQHINSTNAEVTSSNKQNKSAHPNTSPNTKSAGKVQGVKFSKTDHRYWMQGNRLFKYEGSTTYSFQVQYRGDRHSFPTSSSEKALAAKIAAGINLEILHNGMDAVLSKYRPQKSKAESVATVGEWINAARHHLDILPKTFNGNASYLRQIVAHICKIKVGPERFGPQSGGSSEYREKVDAQSLEVLSYLNIQNWKNDFVANVTKGRSKKSRMTSCNSAMRQARSLFTQHLISKITDLRLPTPPPFEGVQFFPKQGSKYKSLQDYSKLVAKAQTELEPKNPSAFLAILLGLYGGLRASEMDRLLWKDVDTERNQIFVDGTKTAGSTAPVDIDEKLSKLLSKYKKAATGKFVLESDSEIYGETPYGYRYRAIGVLDATNAWLRANGVTVQKPIHELRKECGSLVNQQHGLYAASVHLRHSSTAITAAHYVDLKTRPAVKIGNALDAAV
jgi:integrase